MGFRDLSAPRRGGRTVAKTARASSVFITQPRRLSAASSSETCLEAYHSVSCMLTDTDKWVWETEQTGRCLEVDGSVVHKPHGHQGRQTYSIPAHVHAHVFACKLSVLSTRKAHRLALQAEPRCTILHISNPAALINWISQSCKVCLTPSRFTPIWQIWSAFATACHVRLNTSCNRTTRTPTPSQAHVPCGLFAITTQRPPALRHCCLL